MPFCAEFKLLMFHNNIVKIVKISKKKVEQAELVENPPPSHLPFSFLHNLPSFLLVKKDLIF